MMAPVALLVINATRDAPQFSVKEAARSVGYASERFRLLGRADAIRQVAVESGHDYNRPMREAMYGWLDRWLRDKGDGGPVTEPEVTTEDPQTLEVLSRWPILVPRRSPRFPHSLTGKDRGWRRSPRRRPPSSAGRPTPPGCLDAPDEILGGFPRPVSLDAKVTTAAKRSSLAIEMTPEPGLRLRLRVRPGQQPPRVELFEGREETILVLGTPAPDADQLGPEIDTARMVQVRATRLHRWGSGPRAVGSRKPILSPESPTMTRRSGPSGWDAPCSASGCGMRSRWVELLLTLGTDARGSAKAPELPRPCRLVDVDRWDWPPFSRPPSSLGSIGSRRQHPGQLRRPVGRPLGRVPMGIIAPDILEVGDTGHLASLVAPRPLQIGGGIDATGTRPNHPASSRRFLTRAIYGLVGASEVLKLGGPLAFPRRI